MYSKIAGLFLMLLPYGLNAQSGYTKQELFGLLHGTPADTILIDTYNELTWPIYSYDQPDSSVYFANKAISLAKKTNDNKRLSIAYRRLGITYINTGEYKKAIANEEESYRLSTKLNFKRGMYLALNNIGVAYLNSELLNKALTYFLQSLTLIEEAKDYSTAINVYTNCGLIYGRISDGKKSKEYFLKALALAKTKDDKNLLVIANCNLSATFRNLHQLDSSRFYLNEAKRSLDDDANTDTKLNYYLNEGLLDSFTKQNKKALESFLESTRYINNPGNEITLYINIAEEYSTLKNPKKALEYYQKAFDLGLKNKTYSNLEYTSKAMAKIYRDKKDWDNFATMIDFHQEFKDSNTKINAVQQIQKQQLEFEFQRKQIADSMKFAHREHLKNAQLQIATERLSKQKTFGAMLIVLLVTIIVVCLFIFSRFVVIRRQKKTIELQKQIMDVKNQEVLDSINYARRLQRAILPQISDIKNELNFDLLYLPKDIIGGDFYFFEKHSGFIFFAICDCTGHGIPGAIMSVVCCQALQKSIKEFSLTDPGEILSKTRLLIIESLNASQHNIKDGMDCSLIAINTTINQVSWAGANNPLWIINNDDTIEEIKADKQPVAFYENHKEFTTHQINVKAGSALYLFTDGYADQFGGLRGKKFKNKALKNLLAGISKSPVEIQVELMQQNFISWKNNLDQVDDVAVAVIRF